MNIFTVYNQRSIIVSLSIHFCSLTVCTQLFSFSLQVYRLAAWQSVPEVYVEYRTLNLNLVNQFQSCSFVFLFSLSCQEQFNIVTSNPIAQTPIIGSICCRLVVQVVQQQAGNESNRRSLSFNHIISRAFQRLSGRKEGPLAANLSLSTEKKMRLYVAACRASQS